MGLIRIWQVFILRMLRNLEELAAENPALRQQLAVLTERKKRPRSRTRDRISWTWLSRL